MPSHACRSFELDHVAGALGQPGAVDADQLADEHLDVALGVVAGGSGERLEPVHVAVVVGAEQVDLVREAAVALVEVVGGVGGEVGADAVGAADDAVLVVAEVGGAHPHRAVLLEDVALGAEPLHGVVDRVAPGGRVDLRAGCVR